MPATRADLQARLDEIRRRRAERSAAAADSAAFAPEPLLAAPQPRPAAIDPVPAPAADTATEASTAAASGMDAGLFSLGKQLSEMGRRAREQRREVDIQRLGAPLEVALDAITAGGRGLARVGRDAFAGQNPLVRRDANGQLIVPFLEGVMDTRSSWRDAARRATPAFDVSVPLPMVPNPIGKPFVPGAARVTGGGVANAAGSALDVALDPAMYVGVGGLTDAGRALRAAEVGVRSAELELAGALNTREALASTRALRSAMDKLTSAREASALEGTLGARGRAAFTVAGRTNPVLAASPVVQSAQQILGKLQATQLGRGLSVVFQPPEMRVDPAVRARGYRVQAAAAVGRRDAARGLRPLLERYKPLVKAMGGDHRAVDDALSVAVERSQGRRFDKPLDFLTDRERSRFWQTESPEVKAQLEAEGARRAELAVPTYLDAVERSQWRKANREIGVSGGLVRQLRQPVEFSEQLGQKHLSRAERRELNLAQTRARARDEAFMTSAAAPGSVAANPNDVATVDRLQGAAVDRQRAVNRTSVGQAYGALNEAQKMRWSLLQKAQERAHAQALQNSVLAAQRAYFRGAVPEAKALFGGFAADLARTVNARNASMFLETSREGVRLSELADPLAYMMHATTPEAQRAILAHAAARGEIPAGMGWREFTEKHGSQLTRQMRMTAVEANELARAGRLTITGNKPVSQFFYTNPLIAQVMREGAGAQQRAYARHLRELAKLYGRPVGTAPSTWRAVPNDVIGIGDQYVFEPEVADHLTRYKRVVSDPAGVLATWDRLHQIWKTWTLGVFPVYHTRNEVGDLINAVMLGGADLRHAGYAMDELMQGTAWARKIGRHADDSSVRVIDGRAYRPGEMRDEAEALDVIDSGQLRQTAERIVLGPDARREYSVREALATPAPRPGLTGAIDKAGDVAHAAQRRLTDNGAIDLATTVGDMREQAMRLMLYIDRRARGWSPEAAALWTKKHLIDYGQLSDAERGVLQRLVPFYSWTRHNAPLQLEYLFARPGNFAALQHAREAAAGDEPLGTGGVPLPSFLQSGVPIRTGTNDAGEPQFTRLEGLLPMTDALKPIGWADAASGSHLGLGDEAGRDILSRVSPFLTTPLEAAYNVDFWKSRGDRPVPIEQFPGEEGSFLGMSMPRRTIDWLQLARPLTELNRLNPGNVFGTDTEPSVFGELQDYPPVAPELRWANLMLGRSYAVNEGREQMRWTAAREQMLRSIARQAAEAQAHGHEARAQHYLDLYERLLDTPEAITPDMRR